MTSDGEGQSKTNNYQDVNNIKVLRGATIRNPKGVSPEGKNYSHEANKGSSVSVKVGSIEEARRQTLEGSHVDIMENNEKLKEFAAAKKASAQTDMLSVVDLRVTAADKLFNNLRA